MDGACFGDGNTKKIAEKIQAVTGADIERLDTVIPYTGTDEEIVDQGRREVNQGYMPKIKPLSVNGRLRYHYNRNPYLVVYNGSRCINIPEFQQPGGKNGYSVSDTCGLAGSHFAGYGKRMQRFVC